MELPGFAIVNEKNRPHPWDTHYHFSTKTLLSNHHGALAVWRHTQKKIDGSKS